MEATVRTGLKFGLFLTGRCMLAVVTRILLVNPAAGGLTVGLKNLAKVEPLGLEILAAAVPGHEVEILDMDFDRDVRGALERFRPELVGVSAQIVQTYNALEVLRVARQHDPGVMTLVGGHHATLCPQDFSAPQVDAVVLGEGVAPFREIVARWEAGELAVSADGVRGIEQIAGLAVKKNGRLELTSPRPIPPNLDHQPLPDRSLTARDRHRYFYLHESPVALVQTSMGCPFPCSFCSCQVFSSRHFVPRSAESVADELEGLDEDFVIFADDHSFTNVRRMECLHDLIVERGIRKRFFMYSRVDTVVQNPDTFERWGKIGLELLMTGLEAVDNRALSSVNKRTQVETNERALDILERAGVGVSAGFLVLPEHTEDDFRRIDRYVKARPNILLYELTPLTPLPGTMLHAEYQDRLVTDHREVYDLAHFVVPTELPANDMNRLLRRYYGRATRRAIRRMRFWHPRNWLQRHVPRLLWGATRDWIKVGRGHRIPPADPERQEARVG